MIQGVAQAIPYPAWQQAVFVALFLVLIALILFWVSRENKATRVFQHEESTAREQAQGERDAQWREFLQQQRENDQALSEGMKESLDGLTAVISRLVEEVQGGRADFSAHDAMEKAALSEMSASIHARRRAVKETL